MNATALTRFETVTPAHVESRLDSGESLQIVDVRTSAEHATLRPPGAISAPLGSGSPDALADSGKLRRDEPVYLFCQTGNRARRAADAFATCGFEECVVIEGGCDAWARAGLPLERGPSRVISLERQVRIGAGTLVLGGIALGVAVHPAFLGLSAFVGAGLAFAGITNTCGMAMVLTRMPWNQATDQCSL